MLAIYLGVTGDDMSISGGCRVLPWFEIAHVPKLTALAASVFATMLYPDEDQEKHRLACAQSICLDWRARWEGGDTEDELPVVRRELSAVLDFARRVPFDKLMSLGNEGILAGEILKFVLLMHLDPSQDASVKKAVALVVKFKPVSERKLTSLWAQFKSVSHLWAAYNEQCYRFQLVGPEWQMNVWLSSMKDPRPVLAIADHYRDWAINHVPNRSRDARTLESSQTWRIPKTMGPLPRDDFFNPQRLYEGLKPEARELLDRYRHK